MIQCLYITRELYLESIDYHYSEDKCSFGYLIYSNPNYSYRYKFAYTHHRFIVYRFVKYKSMTHAHCVADKSYKITK